MAWSLIEEVPTKPGSFTSAERTDSWTGVKFRPTSNKTIALSVWRHHPCGKMACGLAGAEPGECLWCKSTSTTRRGKR